MASRTGLGPREWADPHALADHDLAQRLRPPAPWERVVVLGDSIAEGVREPLAGYRDLSWSERLAAGFSLARPGAVLFNLGRRGLTASEIRATQLEAALALGPDLAIVTAGGNDLLRRDFAPGALYDELLALLGPLRATGADVLTMDLLDNTGAGHVPARHVAAMRARLEQLVAVTRAATAAVGGSHARLREHPAAGDADLFATDGLHLTARGHAVVAADLARHLGAAHGSAAERG